MTFTVIKKLKTMKQEPTIPQLKFQSGVSHFKVQTIQKFTEEHPEIDEGPHSHNYYEMIWVTKGEGTLHVDMQEFEISNNTIFCLRPGQAHQFQACTGIEGFVLSFTDFCFRMDDYDFNFNWESQASILRLFIECQVTRITQDIEEDMKEIVLKMIKEFDHGYSYRSELLKRYFKIFLIYLARRSDENAPSAEQTRETQLIKSFMESLDKNFKETKMVAEYAEQLSVTPNHLNRVVKKHTSFSAGHHIRQRIVLEAKRMGRYTGAGMKEIAYSLGFLDPAHFSRFFKAFAGTNFSTFKKRRMI
jgi:AraC family transcriptional activator of pobA